MEDIDFFEEGRLAALRGEPIHAGIHLFAYSAPGIRNNRAHATWLQGWAAGATVRQWLDSRCGD
jgi:hypothetical protein